MSDLASSYIGSIYQLAQEVNTLSMHGNALWLMGPLAPPCLVGPYRKYVVKVREALDLLYAEFKRENGDEAFGALVDASKELSARAAELPALIGSYSDAPAAWQPEAYGSGSAERTPVGGLGQSQLENYLRDAMSRLPVSGAPSVVRATEAVGGFSFWRGLWTTGRGVLSWGMKWLPAILVFEAGMGGMETVFALAREKMKEQPSSEAVRSAARDAIESFEEDYWPRVAQQWQAMIRIYRMSMGNPELVRAMMAAWDPQRMERPIPPKKSDYDVFSLGDLLGVETYKPRHQWIAIPILVGGSLGAVYAVGD